VNTAVVFLCPLLRRSFQYFCAYIFVRQEIVVVIRNTVEADLAVMFVLLLSRNPSRLQKYDCLSILSERSSERLDLTHWALQCFMCNGTASVIFL
jgi:hypothetical protein